MPHISDIIQCHTGYQFLSKLDISMQYYTFELDDESKDLCTIATPFRFYQYNCLPMGVMVSPDIAQEVMECLLKGIDDVDVYIDDIGVFSLDWTSHISVIDKVLTILQESGFMVNPTKCKWAVQETNFLGYWLTPHGIAPYKRKVQAILQMLPPKNIKQLRSFLGLVNFYHDMWPHRSHVLAPLTDLTGSNSFIWTSTHHEAFSAMKAMVAKDVMLAYPDHNKPFTIETNASDYQLGAVIKQDGRPVSYYSQKLMPTQKNYTTTEKELLSIVETLREFRSMLLGAPIHIYTDHSNLTHKMTQFTIPHIMCWRLLIEESGTISLQTRVLQLCCRCDQSPTYIGYYHPS